MKNIIQIEVAVLFSQKQFGLTFLVNFDTELQSKIYRTTSTLIKNMIRFCQMCCIFLSWLSDIIMLKQQACLSKTYSLYIIHKKPEEGKDFNIFRRDFSPIVITHSEDLTSIMQRRLEQVYLRIVQQV